MKRVAIVLTGLLIITACDREPPPDQPGSDRSLFHENGPVADTQPVLGRTRAGVAADALLGAWSADGENFVWVIEADSILFEADMLKHPYRISGDTLLIDRHDPAGGMQKTRITRVTPDSLYITDAMHGSSEVLSRLR